MKIRVNFNELTNALSYANTVLSDKSVQDKSKNFIFSITKEKFLVVGYSPFIFSRTELEDWEDEEGNLPEEGWSFQIKASELNKILSSFSSLYRTRVTGMYFYEEGVRIGVSLHEEPINEEDAKLEQDSNFYLENAPITGKVISEISTEFPEESEVVDSNELSFYFETLFPIMSNDTSSSLTSKLNFANDYVFVISTSMSAFVKNKLPDSLKDMALTYSSASFLKKVCSTAETGISVARLDKYLCVQSGNTEAFMKYQKVKVNYKMYVERRSKDNGLVVDRLYLKDVLKRMGNLSTDGKVLITENGDMQVENSNFTQVIPVNSSKGEVQGMSFNLSVPIFEKLILGVDEVFTGDLFMYFVPISRGYIVYVSDSTGAWFSNMQVTK